mgnify:CR=1 FL=1
MYKEGNWTFVCSNLHLYSVFIITGKIRRISLLILDMLCFQYIMVFYS